MNATGFQDVLMQILSSEKQVLQRCARTATELLQFTGVTKPSSVREVLRNMLPRFLHKFKAELAAGKINPLSQSHGHNEYFKTVSRVLLHLTRQESSRGNGTTSVIPSAYFASIP